MKKRPEPDAVSMTPMIDIVFQMIIFFVCTVDLDREKFSQEIEVPKTPNSEEVIENDSRTIHIQISQSGDVMLGSAIFSPGALRGALQQAVQRYDQNIPIVIRADGRVNHDHVANTMDIVSKSGLWNISFTGLVNPGSK
jgi:biopolymer transport protein ExbD